MNKLCSADYHIVDSTSGCCQCKVIQLGIGTGVAMQLTPREAIEALEKRFELGMKHYGDHMAWNAHTNQERLDDLCWIEERIYHARVHLDHFFDVIYGIKEDDADDDGAAIMWLGCMLHMAYKRRKELALQRQGKE